MSVFQLFFYILLGLRCNGVLSYMKKEDDTVCPSVKGARNFDLASVLPGKRYWTVVNCIFIIKTWLFATHEELINKLGRDDYTTRRTFLNDTDIFQVIRRLEGDLMIVQVWREGQALLDLCSRTLLRRIPSSELEAGLHWITGSTLMSQETLLGPWYVIQYYAASEEDVVYKCMRTVFSMQANDGPLEMELNITFSFVDDPDNELLTGNITYIVPDMVNPSHWVHTEDPFTETYNTHVLDTDNSEWALLLNCAEKPKSPRYLTSLMISKTKSLSPAVISFLRDKLPRYDIALDYMFEMRQDHCEDPSKALHYAAPSNQSGTKKIKHPLKRKTRSKSNVKRH